jgi:TolA-binding protein
MSKSAKGRLTAKARSITFVFIGLLFSVAAAKVAAEESAKLEQAKSNIISLIGVGNYTEAQAQTQKLLSDFSKEQALPQALYEIAEKFRWSGASDKDKDKYGRAQNVYQQIITNYPDSPFASKAALGIAKTKVLYFIVAQDFNTAGQALNEMIAGFSKHPDLPEQLYWIGRGYGYWDRYEEEKGVYQQIIQNHPDSPYADKARFGISRANVLSLIMSQNYDQAEDAFGKLLVDFPGHPNLEDAHYRVAEGYYHKALELDNKGLQTSAKDLYTKAAEVWHKQINDFPASSQTPEVCCRAGDCYFKVGKYEDSVRCFQKVVDNYPKYEHAWHAQFTVGRCYEEMKNSGKVEKSTADAKINTAYKQIVEKYPDCPAAKYAHNWLSHQLKDEKEKQK